MTEVEAALARVEAQLGWADYQSFRRLVNTLLAAPAIVGSSRAILSRLRQLFGLQSSGRSRDILGDQGSDSALAAAAEDDSSVADEEADDPSDVSEAASDGTPQPPASRARDTVATRFGLRGRDAHRSHSPVRYSSDGPTSGRP